MLCLIDSCQSKVSTDQYHVTILWAQVKSSSRSSVFLKLATDRAMGFLYDRGLKPDYYSRGERGRPCKGNILVKLEP